MGSKDPQYNIRGQQLSKDIRKDKIARVAPIIVGKCTECKRSVYENSDYVDLEDEEGELTGEVMCKPCDDEEEYQSR